METEIDRRVERERSGGSNRGEIQHKRQKGKRQIPQGRAEGGGRLERECGVRENERRGERETTAVTLMSCLGARGAVLYLLSTIKQQLLEASGEQRSWCSGLGVWWSVPPDPELQKPT